MKALALTIASATLLAAGYASTASAAPQSYPMICKTSNSMTATVRGNGSVTLRYNAASTGANDGPPSAGQCTWLDRPLHPDEPKRLYGDGGFGRYLVDSLLNGGTFYVRVYNDGNGNMIVTHAGP
jgi:hypothetical protein